MTSSSGSRATCGNTSPIVADSTFSSSSEPSGWPTLIDQHAAGLEPLARELEELHRRQVERDVGLAVGVDEDRVVARVDPAQERPRVLGVELQLRPLAQAEVALADVVQLAVDLDAVDPRVREVLRVGARGGAGAVAEDRDPLGRLARTLNGSTR